MISCKNIVNVAHFLKEWVIINEYFEIEKEDREKSQKR